LLRKDVELATFTCRNFNPQFLHVVFRKDCLYCLVTHILDLSQDMKDLWGEFYEIIGECIVLLTLIDCLRDLLYLGLLIEIIYFHSDIELLKNVWVAKDLSFDHKSFSIWILRANLSSCTLLVEC